MPSSVQDRKGAKQLLRCLWLKYPNLHIWVDGNYDDPLLTWAKTCWYYTLAAVVKPAEQCQQQQNDESDRAEINHRQHDKPLAVNIANVPGGRAEDKRFLSA